MLSITWGIQTKNGTNDPTYKTNRATDEKTNLGLLGIRVED